MGKSLEELDMRAIMLMVSYNYEPKQLALVAAGLEEEVRRLQEEDAALKWTIGSRFSLSCTWCGMEAPYTAQTYDAVLAQINEHALHCPEDPHEKEIARLQAKVEEQQRELLNRALLIYEHASNSERLQAEAEATRVNLSGTKEYLDKIQGLIEAMKSEIERLRQALAKTDPIIRVFDGTLPVLECLHCGGRRGRFDIDVQHADNCVWKLAHPRGEDDENS